jgi:hypothetical protein
MKRSFEISLIAVGLAVLFAIASWLWAVLLFDYFFRPDGPRGGSTRLHPNKTAV